MWRALPQEEERAFPHLLQDELWFHTHAACRALNLSLMVNLGEVSSSVLGALPPGQCSNPAWMVVTGLQIGALKEMRLPQRTHLNLWYRMFYRGTSKQGFKE